MIDDQTAEAIVRQMFDWIIPLCATPREIQDAIGKIAAIVTDAGEQIPPEDRTTLCRAYLRIRDRRYPV